MRGLLKNKKVIALLASLVLVFSFMVFMPELASAQAGEGLPGADTLCRNLDGVNCSNITLNQLIIKVINWVLAITLAVDVLFIIIGGFLYITSAGNEERAKKGKTTVINAIIGLVIIILAYVIAQVVSSFFAEEETAI